MFVLSDDEVNIMVSQNVIPSKYQLGCLLFAFKTNRVGNAFQRFEKYLSAIKIGRSHVKVSKHDFDNHRA